MSLHLNRTFGNENTNGIIISTVNIDIITFLRHFVNVSGQIIATKDVKYSTGNALLFCFLYINFYEKTFNIRRKT